jgi:hypothetical protein
LVGIQALAAQSAEINIFAPTMDQVNARFARIQQEIDRLRAAGLNNAADLMAGKLQHFKDQLTGSAPSLIGGPELDVVTLYEGARETGNAVVVVRPTDRPVMLALNSYEPVNWTVNLVPGARLKKVIVSGYDAAFPPANIPANVPVEVYSQATEPSKDFFLYDRREREYPQDLQRLITLAGLPPSTFQRLYRYEDTPFSMDAHGPDRALTVHRVWTYRVPAIRQR